MAKRNTERNTEPEYLRDLLTEHKPGQSGLWLGLVHRWFDKTYPPPHSSMDHLSEKRFMFVQAHPQGQDIPAWCVCDIDEQNRALPRMCVPLKQFRACWVAGTVGTNATGATVPKGCYFWLQTQGQIMRGGKEWDRL